MVSLLPGTNVQHAIAKLNELSSRAQTIRGSNPDPVGLFNDYLSWSVTAMHSLRMLLDDESVIEMLETTRFRLIHAIDPGAYFRPALGDLVRSELEAQIGALDAAAKSLRDELARWTLRGAITQEATTHAGVLDTNILMEHGEHLAERNWNYVLNVLPGKPIALVVPQITVRELDRLKRATGTMRIDGEVVPQRELARRTLRALNTLFPGQETSHELQERSKNSQQVVSPLRILLQLDDLRHEALPDPDAEIIDRALSIRSFAATVTLVTGDTSMRFRAEHAGLHAVEANWGPDSKT